MGLKETCDKHLKNPDLLARDGQTFCNVFVHRVLSDLGYTKFTGFLANQIFDFCSQTPDWVLVNIDDSYDLCHKDIFVLAAERGAPHGHVAIVYPSKLNTYSGKWSRYAPQVASVGKKNGIMGLLKI